MLANSVSVQVSQRANLFEVADVLLEPFAGAYLVEALMSSSRKRTRCIVERLRYDGSPKGAVCLLAHC